VTTDPVEAALQVIQALEALGVPYLIGGSLASTVHGMVRTTQDADLVAELRPEHADLHDWALREAEGDAANV
jgi:hypothetical protein